MSAKSRLKRVMGDRNIWRIQVIKSQIKYVRTNLLGHSNRFKLNSSDWTEPKIFAKPGKHLFFGYYDIQQINNEKDMLLVTEIPQKAKTGKDKALLQWTDLEGKQYHTIAETSAWCWQQGARLRWHPMIKNVVLFNDVEKDSYVTRFYDLDKGKVIKVVPRALYDITPDGKTGLSLNYSRLQRLRPGYGYNTLPDSTSAEKVPEKDGIYCVNIETGKSTLIISLADLSSMSNGSEQEWNYINHISIAPDGEHFMFFHLWTPGANARWKAKLYIARLDGTKLKCLEDEYIISHYCWRNEHELLTTSTGFVGGRSYYFTYDIQSGERKTLESRYLKNDGHPTYLADREHFVTDTYPLSGCMQHVFTENISGDDYQSICDIYSDPRMFGEKRCDLHPRITSDARYLTIDTTFRDGKRSILLFKHK